MFDKWWKPILFWAFSVVAVIIPKSTVFNSLANISYLLLAFALLGLLISSAYQLVKRRWLKAIATGFIFAATIGAFVLYGLLMFFIRTIDGDKWADDLTIPSNIELNIPRGDGSPIRPDSIVNLVRTKTDFELYNSFQPGLFEYDFWCGKLERGTVYLKAFEVTQEYPLSVDRLRRESSIQVSNSTDSVIRFASAGHFTIYEGDWGKPYAARFEVWFKPDNSDQEIKLLQRNYKIEGWQR